MIVAATAAVMGSIRKNGVRGSVAKRAESPAMAEATMIPIATASHAMKRSILTRRRRRMRPATLSPCEWSAAPDWSTVEPGSKTPSFDCGCFVVIGTSIMCRLCFWRTTRVCSAESNWPNAVNEALILIFLISLQQLPLPGRAGFLFARKGFYRP
jgi:hypothetical protein